ncbi:MAG: glycosyltransferase family 39 protein [Chloroflexi bacterium]|nr:glycosyltransferase family 39 protein [Chloroflexota bacterium]
MAQERSIGERSPGGQRASALFRWLSEHQIDLAILAALVGVSAAVRLTLLTDIPLGLHGDEAWTGLDTRRVLDEGWIGPYVQSAFGQPTGMFYVVAPFMYVFGETIFALRLASALVGIATVLMAYVTFRVMFDRPHAAFAAALLSVGIWHLHYSRIAFTLISWPLLELTTLLFLFLGLRTGRWGWFALAGLSLGLGVYTYNAYPVFIGALAVFVVWVGVGKLIGALRGVESRHQIVLFATKIGLMAFIALLAALPLIIYAADDSNGFLDHHRFVSLFETIEWESAGVVGRIDLISDRTYDFAEAAFWSGKIDDADGAGQQAMVDRLSLVLMVAGAAILAWRWRRPASVAVLLMVLLLPLGTVITTQGLFRQTFGIVPFLALLAAVPLAAVWRWGERLVPKRRYFVRAGIAVVLAGVAFLNLSFYFDEYRGTFLVGYTFGPPMTEASLFVDTLPEDTYIYFYSSEWSFGYETRRFLAPNHKGENRAPPFRSNPALTADHEQDLAFIFLGRYLETADEVAQLFPTGTLIEGESFRALLLPLSARPEEGPGIGDVVEPRDRDTVRVASLTVVGRALQQYQDEAGTFPSTSVEIQTLCAAPSDAACALEQGGGKMPVDPFGDGQKNGYWYSSDGSTYTLYAQRETSAFPECIDHPESLREIESLLCVSGP